MFEEIVDKLSSEIKARALTFGENLFINYYPDNPEKIVSVIDGGGMPPDLYYPIREKIVEIKLRATSHDEGTVLGNEIMDLFHSKENYYLGETRVLESYARTDLSYLYADDQERDEFSMELVFLIQK